MLIGTGSTLTGNMWYDPSGNVVQRIALGAAQASSKNIYNALDKESIGPSR